MGYLLLILPRLLGNKENARKPTHPLLRRVLSPAKRIGMDRNTWLSKDDIEDLKLDLRETRLSECLKHGWYFGFRCPHQNH